MKIEGGEGGGVFAFEEAKVAERRFRSVVDVARHAGTLEVLEGGVEKRKVEDDRAEDVDRMAEHVNRLQT